MGSFVGSDLRVNKAKWGMRALNLTLTRRVCRQISNSNKERKANRNSRQGWARQRQGTTRQAYKQHKQTNKQTKNDPATKE